MPSWYQNLPLYLQPIALHVGSFALTWYALAYIVSLGIIGWKVWTILKRDRAIAALEQWLDLMIAVVAGVLIGGRLGFALFYQPSYFAAHPLQIVWPFDAAGVWTGIAGMSFHGGLIGVGLGLWWFARTHRMNQWYLFDVAAVLAPIGSFFGRLANFANGELYGRITPSECGMRFSTDDSIRRYPSQLLEALGEGVLLFAVMQYFQKRFSFGAGKLAALYLMSYGGIRFGIEFFREPDQWMGFFVGGYLTFGQLLCISMMIVGATLWRFRKNPAILEEL